MAGSTKDSKIRVYIFAKFFSTDGDWKSETSVLGGMPSGVALCVRRTVSAYITVGLQQKNDKQGAFC